MNANYPCINLAMLKAAAAAIAPVIITFRPPHQGLTPVILLLKNPKIYKQINVMTAEIFKPSMASVTKK